MKICLCSSLPLLQCIKLIVKICSFHNSTIQIVPTRDYLQQFLGAMSSNPNHTIYASSIYSQFFSKVYLYWEKDENKQKEAEFCPCINCLKK